MRIIKSSITDDVREDHVYNKHILSFVCPICHNKTVIDTERDIYRPYEVDYDDLCICEECGAELYARPQYDGTIQFEIGVKSCDSVEAADYGGAYDIDPEMFFTKEELVELGYEVAENFDAWDKSEPDMASEGTFELADVSMDANNNLYMDISDGDIYLSAVVRIDMRKIRKPSDINKYQDLMLAKLKADYLDYTGYRDVAECDNIMSSVSDTLSASILKSARSAMSDFGFPEDEIDDYLVVEITDDYESEFTDEPMIKVEVRAELSYDSLTELADRLNPIVEKYDKWAYFEPVTGGIIDAYIRKSEVEGCDNISDKIYSYEDVNDEEIDISDYEYMGNREGYQVYRKIVKDADGKHHGEWAAQDQEEEHPPFKVTYMQARGYDPIDKYDSDVKKLGRDLGKMLLPNSSTNITSAEDIGFNEWLYREYGVTSDDMTDEDYDEAYNDYQDYLRSCKSITSSEDSDKEFEEYEDEIKEIDQEFTSENTSINSTKLPAVFKMVSFEPGTVNIDYGGGRFDNVADYLSQYDVINLVYDPYNRTPEHNKDVVKMVKEHGGADTATCSNVLNVIKEPEVRLNVLNNIKKLVKPSGEVYITVYEGTGKGDEGATKSGYQLNRKTADYLEEIQQVFPDAKRKGKLIIAHPTGGSVESSSKVCSDVIPDEMIMDGSDEVMAGLNDMPREYWLDPPEYDDPEEQTSEDFVEITLDADIEIDEDGSWEYLDKEYPFADVDFESYENPNILLDDKISAVEKIDELLEEKLPYEKGTYHISGDVELSYQYTIYYWDRYNGPDEEGDPDIDRDYSDDIDIKWLRDKSTIQNFKYEKL